jgi:hypothetical protein
MGHWADELVGEVAALVGADVDRDRERLLAATRAAVAELETLTGQSFRQAKQSTVSIATFGLPFVELPGLVIGSEESPTGIWPIPNPVERGRATVVQLAQFTSPPSRAAPIASALRFAGNLTHAVAQDGGLSGDQVLGWLGRAFDRDARAAFMRTLTDPSKRIHVPVAAVAHDGWWFQITRRLLWVTPAMEEQRLIEPLITDADDAVKALCAVEPLLIVARVTKQPADWAMAVRIWPSVQRPSTPWRFVADAIRGHGIPILTIDPKSTAAEIQAQLLLLAYWHSYIGADEPELADVTASAYPEPVGRILRKTSAPDQQSAAALLLEGLLHPGFDPAMGAEATRRYVSRKATIAILNDRKTSRGAAPVWEMLGVSERRYYKLLKRFAPKIGGRYEVDGRVLDKIRDYLAGRDQHAAAVDLLQARGFSHAAARKWLQRHSLSEAPKACPRGSPAPRSS